MGVFFPFPGVTSVLPGKLFTACIYIVKSILCTTYHAHQHGLIDHDWHKNKIYNNKIYHFALSLLQISMLFFLVRLFLPDKSHRDAQNVNISTNEKTVFSPFVFKWNNINSMLAKNTVHPVDWALNNISKTECNFLLKGLYWKQNEFRFPLPHSW